MCSNLTGTDEPKAKFLLNVFNQKGNLTKFHNFYFFHRIVHCHKGIHIYLIYGKPISCSCSHFMIFENTIKSLVFESFLRFKIPNLRNSNFKLGYDWNDLRSTRLVGVLLGVETCNWHRCFPVNVAKFLRTSFYVEHFRWLLLLVSLINNLLFQTKILSVCMCWIMIVLTEEKMWGCDRFHNYVLYYYISFLLIIIIIIIISKRFFPFRSMIMG